ncbi:hypothetical protein HZH68_015269 [Vespula germanica]|uniref:Uncharacterized protein n=1 Tax=Vespula germanica TaxID=30212 RepID=A0A834MRD7_VESGE|nr:hypothetical protein HZH68_015269 [Vespula germanica]
MDVILVGNSYVKKPRTHSGAANKRQDLPLAPPHPSSFAPNNIVGREHIGTFRIAHVASTSSLASVRYCAPVGKVCVLSSITNAKVRSQPSPTGQMPREALLPISGHSVTISS